ncbi:hypothetical protein THAOC_37755, partial [Thalassiosira oceanica]
MDRHSQQQSSEDASPPDDRLDEGAPAVTDASPTARTASSGGQGQGCPSGQWKPTSSTEAPRCSGRRSRSAGTRSVEHSTAGSSGGGGSIIWDSAHDKTRGKDVHTGTGDFQIRGSRARGDDKEGPPQQRRKAAGVREEGVFVNDDDLVKGTATNMKLKNGARYTGQIARGVPNGTGTVISAEFFEHGIFFVDGFLNGPNKRTFPRGKEEGNFVNGKLDNGTATNTIFHRAEQRLRRRRHLHG